LVAGAVLWAMLVYGTLLRVIAAQWTSLEIAKLAVAALVPLTVAILGIPITTALRRLEHAQWQSRKLIELRLDLYAQMAGPLNDLLCFFRRVGNFQEITPPEALQRKRVLDKAFYVNSQLMNEEFGHRYNDFIGSCFRVYTGAGRPAQLRASRTQQRAERPIWDDSWDELLISDDSTPVGLAELGRHYDALMACFGELIGVRGEQPSARGRLSRRINPLSALIGLSVAALIAVTLLFLA
jgi:hypothetical protein